MDIGFNLHFLEVQNFRSFGAKKTVVDFRTLDGLTAIIGDNLDLTDEDAKNGCGKSALFIDALAFNLTGDPVKAVPSNLTLVNHVNQKGLMTVTEGTHKGEHFRIERGLAPTVTKFYRKPIGCDDPWTTKNGAGDPLYDRTKGGSPQTAKDIEAWLGFDLDMFKLVMCSATKTPAFFGMGSPTQKSVIETLFGFEVLSRKAESISNDRKQLDIKKEVEDARIAERNASRERTEKRWTEVTALRDKWAADCAADLARLDEEIAALAGIDFEAEKKLWDEIASARTVLGALEKNLAERGQASRSLGDVVSGLVQKQGRAESEIAILRETDFASLLKKFDAYEEAQRDLGLLKSEHANMVSEGRQLVAEELRIAQEIENLRHHIEDLKGNCVMCGQKWPDHVSREKNVKQTETSIRELENAGKSVAQGRKETEAAIGELHAAITQLQKVAAPVSAFKKRDDALTASAAFDQKLKALEAITEELDEAQSKKHQADEEHEQCKRECHERRQEVATLLEKTAFQDAVEIDFTAKHLSGLRTEKATKSIAVNPHSTLLESLELELAEPVDGAELDRLDLEVRHHKYLEKLLGRKDSEVRRLITGKWLPKLNERLSYYLSNLGLPYIVIFKDDMSAGIFNFEQKMVYSDLSSGEEERVILALNLAFRDVFEALHFPVNFLLIDERLDVGLDGAGRQRCVNTLKEVAMAGRSVLMITHNAGLVDQADRIITVTKKARFSSIDITEDTSRKAA